ncbi:lipopolysaccharide export system protein LptA [Silvimonas terrae]|uniref:Lipopolysaccharide export system protein LptA n=1 Tax=Silvimonas terrae TaxID=300266 RepID=A0A840RIC5_9NEIS|nr:lipopolysaccharide transport periplasmic protein LptA [Silvimonas terrae]MBB5193075.1 lipopolysaccharide export system protein LptA [Silvimonas terrae]
MSLRSAAANSVLFASLALALGVAFAATADREKPLKVEADSATYDQKANTGVYTGNVIVTQGSMTLRSDKLTVHQDADGMQYSQGDGRPVKFRQQADDGEWVDAESLHYDYNQKTGLLVLTNKAWVRKGQNEVFGDVITYNLNNDQYSATSNKTGAGRVNVTIVPKKPAASGPAAKPAPAVASDTTSEKQ